ELAEQGAPCIDWLGDCPLLLGNNWAPRSASDLRTRACTRNLLELLIRQRLSQLQPIKLLDATKVTALLTNPERTVVTGVYLQEQGGTTVELPAQLVIDASGRHSQTPQWLKQLEYEMPQETIVNSFLGYSSRLYEYLGNRPDYKALYIMPQAPAHTRGSVMYQVEGGRWMVSLIGVGRDYPPSDEQGFLDFAQSLRSPEVYQAIKEGHSCSPISSYRGTENCCRHYEQLSRFPANFAVVGDAVCAFNPVYGQGMTVATLGALTLQQCLQHQRDSQQGLTGFSQRFQKQLARVNSTPWMMATGDDFRWSTTEGKAPGLSVRLMHKYIDQVLQLASERAKVYRVFAEVVHMLKQPTAFFHPSIVLQVLKLALNRGSSATNKGQHILPKQLGLSSNQSR
ncbi:MAG: hypothetical protein JOZ78_09470, partial [Chroococcidiopsidaceae cyanobacterium CP_BM_ER_R8_30]|nr:hypothetical protein [Chroococcidiopsidaceae cyanobacterium CP_BM_ER_R8_30]